MKSNNTISENRFMNLAFEKANKNLGSTKNNPSVGCVVVKNGSVISSGSTSINGRPHAEGNALKEKKNYIGSTMYVTLEPCSHYGQTPPCVNTIVNKGIKKVCYSILDPDNRSKNKAKSLFNKKKIKVKVGLLKTKGYNFYKSYILSKNNKSLPFMDAKIAISRDYFSVNKKKKWITNDLSRAQVHLIRSRYDCILSTYKSINNDNSILNCRINGLNALSPSRIIIDKNLNLRKNLNIYKSTKKIKTYIVTSSKNKIKKKFFKSKNINLIKMDNNREKFTYREILSKLKKKGFSRILCESGFYTTKGFLRNNLVHNLYVFKSNKTLNKNGRNSYKNLLSILRIKDKKKIKVNLSGDEMYKLKIK